MALAPTLSQYDHAKKIHFVGHSLGGMMVRFYLEHYTLANLGRIVMIGTGNQGWEMYNLYRHLWLFNWLLGPIVQESGDDEASLPKTLYAVDYEVGIIAGTLSLNPWSYWIVPRINDGAVSVHHTCLKSMRNITMVPNTHELLPYDPRVLSEAFSFLKTGRFLLNQPDFFLNALSLEKHQ